MNVNNGTWYKCYFCNHPLENNSIEHCQKCRLSFHIPGMLVYDSDNSCDKIPLNTRIKYTLLSYWKRLTNFDACMNST